MTGSPLPSAKDVRDVLEGLTGRDVDLVVGGDPVTPATTGAVVGVYVTESLGMEALIAMDLPLAARVGAALALVPPGGANLAIEDGHLPATLLDNTAEVLNVMASLFNVGDAPHLRLYRTHDTATALLPADVATHLRGYGPRLDATATVKGYGAGQLSVVVR
jgi:hypothetical protein